MINWFKKWIMKPFLFLMKISLILIFLVITYNFAISENNTGSIIFAGFSLFFILFFFGSNFEIVELLGTKFKLRELKDSLEELRLLAKLNAEAILQLSQLQGRFYIAKIEIDKQKRYEETVNVLKKLNVPVKEIEEITNTKWHIWNENDYFHRIYQELKDALRKEKSDKIQFLLEENKKLKTKSPEELQKLMKKIDFNPNPEILEYLEDYKFYIKNKEHRDFKRWLVLSGLNEEEE